MHRGRRSIIKEKITISESGGGGDEGEEEEGENQLKLWEESGLPEGSCRRYVYPV